LLIIPQTFAFVKPFFEIFSNFFGFFISRVKACPQLSYYITPKLLCQAFF